MTGTRVWSIENLREKLEFEGTVLSYAELKNRLKKLEKLGIVKFH